MQDDNQHHEMDASLAELRDLLSDFAAGKLTEEQDKQLQQLATESKAARRLYLQYMDMYGTIHRRLCHRDKFQNSFPFLVDANEEPQSESSSTSNRSIFPLLEIEGDLLSSCNEANGLDVNQSDTSNSNNVGGFWGQINFSFVPGLIMVVASTLILSAVVILPVYWSIYSEDPGWKVVARINQMSNCEWKKGCEQFKPGSFLISNQVLDLERGVAEVQFCSGASVILQGPARFAVTEQNAGQLDFGRLTATVVERAQGFAVKTPAVDLVDLGTEFGVFIDTEHNSDVHVFKGKVQVETDPSTENRQKTLLTEEQAIYFDAQTSTIEERPAESKQFVCSMVPLTQPLNYVIESESILPSGRGFSFAQSRATLLPYEGAQLPKIVVVTQIRDGDNGYRDLFQVKSSDLGFSWTKPRVIHSLKRATINAKGDERVIGDLCPQLHRRSGVVLGTGKTFTYDRGEVNHENSRQQDQISYSVYDAKSDHWSGLNILVMPERDHSGAVITESDAGGVQRFDLPDGDILLPIRYRRKGTPSRILTSTVARCSFDGEKLTYKEHGTEMTIDKEWGLTEASITNFQGHYYLTLRAEQSGYVTRGTDGLNYEPVREWTFDDGTPLGNYNSQQHWVTHSDGLFLVYTRMGANNDHIKSHRAPLFIAQVDPERLCVIRNTERVLIPENNADLGNFGVVDVTPLETWVVVAERPQKPRQLESGKTIIAKLYWSKPNMAMQPLDESSRNVVKSKTSF